MHSNNSNLFFEDRFQYRLYTGKVCGKVKTCETLSVSTYLAKRVMVSSSSFSFSFWFVFCAWQTVTMESIVMQYNMLLFVVVMSLKRHWRKMDGWTLYGIQSFNACDKEPYKMTAVPMYLCQCASDCVCIQISWQYSIYGLQTERADCKVLEVHVWHNACEKAHTQNVQWFHSIHSSIDHHHHGFEYLNWRLYVLFMGVIMLDVWFPSVGVRQRDRERARATMFEYVLMSNHHQFHFISMPFLR